MFSLARKLDSSPNFSLSTRLAAKLRRYPARASTLTLLLALGVGYTTRFIVKASVGPLKMTGPHTVREPRGVSRVSIARKTFLIESTTKSLV